ncbi:MAG: MlaD family protein [Deltaproteobacteria bacterium]|jgi:phospholipid/cholesterol/gamma-HCH transport system substrate-binding protein
MASQKTKFSVGLFLAGGITVGLVAFIWLGMSRYLEKGQYYVTYFNESVQGLDKDSQVKYRGVAIGRVESISVAPDSKLIQVVMKIESGQALGSDIVAQLKAVGITGSVFVELDQKKKDEPDRSPTLTFPSEYPIVASKPSEITQFFTGVDEILNQIKAVDLEGIAGKIKLDLDAIHQAVVDAEIKQVSHKAQASLDSVNHILDQQRWDKILASLEELSGALNSFIEEGSSTLTQVKSTFAEAEETIVGTEVMLKSAVEDLRVALKKTNLFLDNGSSLFAGAEGVVFDLRSHLLVTAQNLEKASVNLDRLIELVADQPSRLFFAEPPPPGKRETDVEYGK